MRKPMAFVLLLALAWGGADSARAAEHVWENFDGMPLGPIASQPNWTGFFAARTAHVSNARSHSPSNSLHFPWNTNSPNATAATHSNLNVSLGDLTGQVVRADFHLFLQNTNVPFVVSLTPSSGEGMTFFNQGGVGRIGFDPYHSTAIPLAVNRFVPVTMLYHAGRNQYALEYDGERVVDWANAERATSATQFIYAIFLRSGDTSASAGDMFVDNVRVETYPYDLWAWWRCTWADNYRVPEQLGQFMPAWRAFHAADAAESYDPVWDGWNEFRNEGATRYLVASPATNSVATAVTTNWTLEVVVRLSGEHNQSLFQWGRGLGFNSTEAMISLWYRTGLGLGFDLRDAQQATTDGDSQVLVPFAADGRWHHLALVKSQTTMLLYVDYQLVATAALNSFARGGYAFGAGTLAAIGRTLNNGSHLSEETVIDEIRFSSRSLEPYDFIQPARPLIVQMEYETDNTWNVVFKGILGRSYRIESSPVLGPGENWTVDDDDYVVDSVYSYFWSNALTPRRYVRIIRK